MSEAILDPLPYEWSTVAYGGGMYYMRIEKAKWFIRLWRSVMHDSRHWPPGIYRSPDGKIDTWTKDRD